MAPPPRDFAIYFHPDAYVVEGRNLMGRRAAGKGFLGAYLASAMGENPFVYADSRGAAQNFGAIAKAAGRERARFVLREDPRMLAEAGTLYWPSPDFEVEAWRRAQIAPNGWSLMGVTHTTASTGVMDTFTALPSGAMQPYDAVICTSRVVRHSVDRMLDAAEAHLAERTGATRFVRPQRPVIPLGVDCAALAPDAARRGATRQRMGFGATDVAVLFLGRLSWHAKAHHVPMLIALERAAKARPEKLHLILCGWFANDFIEKTIRASCARFAPSVALHVVDGRDDDAKASAWAAADLYCSLVDNVQETFGLSPIEAMAAGIPAVVSDWDGYKDTVRDGEDGFRIPTTQPGPDEGRFLIDRHATGLEDYDRYLLSTVHHVIVDIPATADAFTRLIADPGLRARMGATGRAQALAQYDWPHIVNRYRDLAGELADIRQAHPAKPHRWPARLSPWDAFVSYPTRQMRGDDRILRDPARDVTPSALVEDRSTQLDAGLADRLIGFADLAPAGETVVALMARFAPAERPAALTELRKLVKYGVLRLEPAAQP